MGKYRFHIFLLILLTIVAVILYVTHSKKSTLKDEMRDFAVKDTGSITKIFLADKSNRQILLERQDGYWLVNKKYKARRDYIKLLLKTIHRVDVKAPVPKGARDHIIKQMAAKNTKVEIYQGDEKVKTYYVGGPDKDHKGTFMYIENSSVPFVTHIPGFTGYLTTRYSTNIWDWRSRLIFKYQFDEIASIKVQQPEHPGKSFKITCYGDNTYTLTSLKDNKPVENFDTVEVKKYISLFRIVPFESFVTKLTDREKDSITSRPPTYIFTIEDFTGSKNTFKTYPRPNFEQYGNSSGKIYEFDVDNLYAVLEDNSWVLIQYYVFDLMFKDIDDFQQKTP